MNKSMLAPVLACITLIQLLASSSSLALNHSRRPVPLEQVISQIRKHHGDVVIWSARLTKEEQRDVRVVDFMDHQQSMQRMVIDAYSGKELELAPMRQPVPLEKALKKVKERHKAATILKSWLDQQNGQNVRIIEFVDKKNKRWQTTLDAYTGLVLNEYSFKAKATGKMLTLDQIIERARKNHQGMLVLRTRLTSRSGAQVREILYLDNRHLKKRLVVNALTGEVVEDKQIASLTL